MKKAALLFALLGIFAINPQKAQSQAICGNPNTPTAPPPCGEPSTKSGTNVFDAYTGGVHRLITDLRVSGTVGDIPLKFERLTTSRYLGALPTPLGSGGSWRHNWLWFIHYGGLDASGNEIIIVDYPDGSNWWFHKTNPGDAWLTAVSKTTDRVAQDGADPNLYTLQQADGSRLIFRKTVSGSNITFRPDGIYDRFNLFYPFQYDSKGRITRVTEPAGRYLDFTYGAVGNFTSGQITFSYTNTSATSVSIAGDFNGWNTTANPLTQQNGIWKVTLPLQIGSWQYKFVVNGSTWLSDPTNPTTVPAGGPQTGNNSLATVQQGDKDLDASAPTPVQFNYTSASATSVYVSGSFNGWSTTANPLTKSGSVWSTTVSIPSGTHQYKLVVNGQWITDPQNPFTSPDGYGGSNSRLAVGALDEALLRVQSSLGEAVDFRYEVTTSGATIYSGIKDVDYNDGTQAHYTYSPPSPLEGVPSLLQLTTRATWELDRASPTNIKTPVLMDLSTMKKVV